MLRIATTALSILVFMGASVPAAAWKGELAGQVRSIAEVQEKAESGDYVVVEGQVVEVRSGMGSLMIVTLEDETGRLPIAVPEYLRREFGDKPHRGPRVRVGGKWDHKYMDPDTWGMRAQKVERLED